MNEYCVKAETRQGKIRMLRRGFVSQSAAEDHPIQLAKWNRVWVERLETEPRERQNTKIPRQDRIERCFEAIVEAAVVGERCPENGTRGVGYQWVSALTAAGRIKVEVFARNFRVVTILTGQHAGKSTAPPPYKVQTPKYVITKQGKTVFKRLGKRTSG